VGFFVVGVALAKLLPRVALTAPTR